MMATPFAHRPLDGTPYVLTGLLGEGGMGHVFAAIHLELNRRAAIKLLGTSVAYQARAMERLRREARALAQVNNPHIIDIYDMGFTADGQPYIAMSYVAGVDLATALERQGPFDPERVVCIAEQVATGLTEVHAQGMVHRDLKPENIMIERRDGREHVVILDFGIARVLDEDTQITRDGQVMGTPGYIAPEQALGHQVDGRADQYGLAAVLYELLTGETAYAGTSGLELMTAQLTQPPRPFDDVEKRIPERMQVVIMRALSRDWSDRYADMHAFAVALRESLTAPPPVAPTRLPYIFAGLIGVAVLSTSAWMRNSESSSVPVSSVSADSPTTLPVPATRSAPQSVAAASASPEPKNIAAPQSGSDTPKSMPTATPQPTSIASKNAPTVAALPILNTPKSAASVAPPSTRSARPKPMQRTRKTPRPTRKMRPRQKPAPLAPRTPAPASAEIAPSTAAPVTLTSAQPVALRASAPATTQTRAPLSRAPVVRPKTTDRLVIGPPQIDGAVSDRPIRKALRRRYPKLRQCVAGLGPRRVGVRAVIRLAIDADGFVQQIQGEGDAALAKCGTQAVRQIRRLGRRPDTGQIRVRLPLKMESL